MIWFIESFFPYLFFLNRSSCVHNEYTDSSPTFDLPTTLIYLPTHHNFVSSSYPLCLVIHWVFQLYSCDVPTVVRHWFCVLQFRECLFQVQGDYYLPWEIEYLQEIPLFCSYTADSGKQFNLPWTKAITVTDRSKHFLYLPEEAVLS